MHSGVDADQIAWLWQLLQRLADADIDVTGEKNGSSDRIWRESAPSIPLFSSGKYRARTTRPVQPRVQNSRAGALIDSSIVEYQRCTHSVIRKKYRGIYVHKTLSSSNADTDYWEIVRDQCIFPRRSCLCLSAYSHILHSFLQYYWWSVSDKS